MACDDSYTVIAVKPPEPDATLKALTVLPAGTLQPAFKPLVLTYAVDEGPEQTTVEINAVANDTDAQVRKTCSLLLAACQQSTWLATWRSNNTTCHPILISPNLIILT